MSSVREQRKRVDDSRDYGQNVFERELAAWTDTTIGEWSIGSSRIPQETETELDVVLRRTYDKIARRFLGVDYRLYKQDEEPDPFDDVMTAIAGAIGALFAERIGRASASILNTLRTMMNRATETANAEENVSAAERQRIARTDLRARMREHRIIIAVTESNWTVNKTHKTAILAVNDELGDSVERIAQLFEAGDTNGARRLARRVLKMARLPTSVRQGQLLGIISDFRDRLVTPAAQGRMIATMRAKAAELEAGEKRWEAIFRNTRPAHAEAHGQVKPTDEPFEVGGYLMQEPMDESLGAPLGQIVNCFVPWQPIEALSPVAVMRRFYDGKVVTIETVSGKQLTVTPNHPVLGENGWIAAHLVKHGDSIACGTDLDGSLVGSDVQGRVTTAEQVYNTFASAGNVVRYSSLAVNLHGERPEFDVDVVDANRKLRNGIQIRDPFAELHLSASNLAAGALLRGSAFEVSVPIKSTITNSSMSGRRIGLSFGGGHPRHSQSLPLASVPRGNSTAFENHRNRGTCVTNTAGYFQHRAIAAKVHAETFESARIGFEPISKITVSWYSGFVYNVHDDKGYMVSNGIVNHNCQCRTVWL